MDSPKRGESMLKFENGENNRFYYIFVQSDLLGKNVLRVIYGGKHHVRRITIYEGNDKEIDKKITELVKRRIKRGYTLIN